MELVKQYNIGKNTEFNLEQLNNDLKPGKYTIKTQAISVNGKESKESIGVEYEVKDPLNPLNLPPFTIRVKFSSGYTPSMGDSQTLVDAGENVWDITNNSTDWTELFAGNSNVIAVLGANTNGVTCMYITFASCISLTTVQLFDTSSCTDMYMMFSDCSSLTAIPLFDTSNATSVALMFNKCHKVQSGALALYQQASTQANPPSEYFGCFEQCGTEGGDVIYAEMAQIPQAWGGNA